MSVQENKTLARQFLRDLWSEGKLEIVDQILAPDFVAVLGVKPYKVEGPAAVKEWARRNREAFQGLKYEINDLVAEEDRVVAYWTMTAKHVGHWGDSAPSNKDVSIHGLSLFRVANGKLVECVIQNEALSLLRQIGTVPPAGETEYKLVEANKAHVRHYIEELLIKGNFAIAHELVTDEFKIDRSAVPDAIAGPEGLHKQMDMLKVGFPDLELRIADIFGAGDKVAVRFEAPGTHLGEFAGIPATGTKVTWRGIVIYHVQDGKVAHAWADWDDVGLLQAIQKQAA